jgi:hypothetical protein
MSEQRKKLSDILAAGSGGNIRDIWNSTAAADDFKLLPPGDYTFRILAGELFTAKKGTPGYKLTLEVTEGEHEGGRAWHDLWLTAPALPMTKRDLAKLGVTRLEQLDRPLPTGMLIRGRIVTHTDDDGNQVNRLKRFEFVGIEPGDAFQPCNDTGQPLNGMPPPSEGSDCQNNELFPYGANANVKSDGADASGKDFLGHERGGSADDE